jgi:hypothetical protein
VERALSKKPAFGAGDDGTHALGNSAMIVSICVHSQHTNTICVNTSRPVERRDGCLDESAVRRLLTHSLLPPPFLRFARLRGCAVRPHAPVSSGRLRTARTLRANARTVRCANADS